MARNGKRKLSAVDGVDNKKMSSRTDTLHEASGVELGCLEIGSKVDPTKVLKDSLVKIPIVLKDMLIAIAQEIPSILNNIHVLGYNINGNSITLLDADVPKGYITRIRRTKPATFPTCSYDFIPRIVPLIKIAVLGKKIVDDTLKKYRSTSCDVMDAGDQCLILPPCIIPGNTSASLSPSSSPVTTTTTATSSSSKSSLLSSAPAQATSDPPISKKRP
ncbi:hypothetical protein BDC45DRAFT_503453 [Circinella umbellata]|nr:hypothetical protein BDC45DRAFT_503453 [Circinella umbellata]